MPDKESGSRERAGDTVERVKEAAGEAAREVTETVKAEVTDPGRERPRTD